ncbi:hypothetical protein [Aureimonas leprariae]|uniref:hypothetical protein n=1 Tax=Plantimonas leprariae TaxID=2615207 RepID=UPI001386E693|nr:hypothetical protein [Aureimonas leprariae]
MPVRAVLLAATAAFALAGCGSLPRFGSALPAADPDIPAIAYKLTDRETAEIRSTFAAALTDGRTPIFGPIEARQKADGDIVVCGLVRLRKPDGRESGMKLFDGLAAPDPSGTLRFEPKRLSGANGKFLAIYTDCRALGALSRAKAV